MPSPVLEQEDCVFCRHEYRPGVSLASCWSRSTYAHVSWMNLAPGVAVEGAHHSEDRIKGRRGGKGTVSLD